MAFVPDTPAVKRQRTANGYNSSSASASNTGAYNSDDDNGDELFAEFIPDTPKRPFDTQPTQILERSELPPQDVRPPVLSSPYAAPPIIQVPASSPIQNQSPRPVQYSTAGVSPQLQRLPNDHGYPKTQLFPIQNPPKMTNFAMSMAPAGTAFRPPPMVIGSKKYITIDDDDDGLTIQGNDSESDPDDRANIQHSKFLPKGRHSSFGAESVSSPPTINGNAKFQSIVSTSAYQPSPRHPMLAPTSSARSFPGSIRQPHMQMKPERARPVDPPINSIADPNLRDGIQRLRQIFPNATVMGARNALLASKGSVNDAADLIARGGMPKSSPMEAIVISDNEIESSPLRPSEPQMKRGLNAPIVSIKDRYSSTQQVQAPPRPTSLAVTPAATPPKPKRKLMQGRRCPTSPAKPSPLKASPAVSLKEYDSDSGVASDSEEDPLLSDRVLKYLNTCDQKELIELTNITATNAELMIAGRPFKTLDVARNIANPAPLKGGKKSTRAPIGDKIVDTAISMFSGYEAIDELVANCESLGRPLAAEMASWGFDVFGAAKNGELEMTSFDDDAESLRDSGIGSPSSGVTSVNGDAGEEDVKITSVKRKRGNVNYLKKPPMMAEDCVLKDYQVVGLNWLALMYRHKLSGILADEMGLGKTCQVIALVSHLVEVGHPGPHLVICPGSTLENWLREFPKFSPGLVVEPYYGSQKERPEMADSILERRDSINVIVTTYDLAAKKDDNKFMRRLNPDVAVYDEGHYLKNINSQRYQGLVKIPSKFRLLLTGTPLQNNLQELAALLAFILPDVFNERREDLDYIFKAKASTRDADHAALLSAQRIARARSMLTPFVLRRKKAQVLKHMPPKTCHVEYCEMHPAQKVIYDGHIEQARERARARIEGTKIPKADENNPLMQLRKASIHPLLFRRHFTDAKVNKMADILRKKLPEYFDPAKKREHLINEMKLFSDFGLHQWCLNYSCIQSFDIPDLGWMDSGKVDAMVKLVKGYKENGDRVLIFSQFALVLDILEAVLNTALIQFTRIDGSTKIDERQTLIDTYRDDESITAFLLTTKAGGTGINLMYANKVIIFDGSFNPQDDRQAENRAHRVGQTRAVEVIRLVTRDTIEEAIFALGVSKLVLDGRVAGDEDTAGEEAGEKAVSKMMLEGIPSVAGTKQENADGADKDVIPALTQRKKSTILEMLTKGEPVEIDGDGEDGEEMLV